MDANYVAGLIDGEGCFDVQVLYPKEGKGRFYCRPRIRIKMASVAEDLLRELHEEFGGHLSYFAPVQPGQSGGYAVEWLNRDAMLVLIDTILPGLRLKREQAKLCKWWLLNATGKAVTKYPGMEQARREFQKELRAMKLDQQRLSDRAAERISQLMRQSDHTGDRVTSPEMREALAA